MRLAHAGIAITRRKPPAPRLPRMPQPAQVWINQLYWSLGGSDENPVLAPRSWDIVLQSGLIVELDEEQHFNRYRRLTLEPQWTWRLPWRRPYVDRCSTYEPDCLRKAGHSGYWSNESSKRQFPGSDSPGVFGPSGSPRWKQRALYDAMRDAAAAAGLVRLARLSIWGDCGGAPLGSVLKKRAPLDLDALLHLIEERTVGGNSSSETQQGGSISHRPALEPTIELAGTESWLTSLPDVHDTTESLG